MPDKMQNLRERVLLALCLFDPPLSKTLTLLSPLTLPEKQGTFIRHFRVLLPQTMDTSKFGRIPESLQFAVLPLDTLSSSDQWSCQMYEHSPNEHAVTRCNLKRFHPVILQWMYCMLQKTVKIDVWIFWASYTKGEYLKANWNKISESAKNQASDSKYKAASTQHFVSNTSGCSRKS